MNTPTTKSKDDSGGKPSSVWDESLRNFVENLASARPTPGGGAVAALSACLAASLLKMMLDIMEKDAPTGGKNAAVTQPQLKELQRGVDDDIAAFDAFKAARKGSAPTEADGSRRQQLISESLLRCAEVPLNTARLALKLVPTALHLSDASPEKLLSDAALALLQLDGSLTGLLLNVDINLHGAASESAYKSVRERRDRLAEEIDVAHRDLSAAIQRIAGKLAE
jgi:formiminotetrahydrofolate cyclodeaminase